MVTSTDNVTPVLPQAPDDPIPAFPPVIRIYSFAPDPERDILPQRSLDFEHNDDTTPRPVLVAQLSVPPLLADVAMSQFEVRPDPAFPPIPRGDQPTLGPRKPFTQDPYKGVLVFDLTIGDPPFPGDANLTNNQSSYELFILREYLIDLSTKGEERLRRSRLRIEHEERLEIWDVALNLSWAEWGEQNSRLLHLSMDTRRWVSHISCIPVVFLVSDRANRPVNRYAHVPDIDMFRSLTHTDGMANSMLSTTKSHRIFCCLISHPRLSGAAMQRRQHKRMSNRLITRM